MELEQARIVDHRDYHGGYMLLLLDAPGISPRVKPGQFVHVRIPHLNDSVLRRPFSVFKAEERTLSLLYKDVGRGTHAMRYLRPGEEVSLLGPLGNPYPVEAASGFPVLVAGGYGMAALYLVARKLNAKGVAFFGGRSKADILCVDEFEALGWEVRVTTDDGSLGTKGKVTDALDPWLARELGERTPEFYSCGPNAMLQAVGRRAEGKGWKAWLSVDRNMACGVGACLTCVLKVKDPENEWKWARACREGPVFESRDVIWDEGNLATVNTKPVE